MRRKDQDELWRLQQELLAVEEEESWNEPDDLLDEDLSEILGILEDGETEEPAYRPDNMSRYRKGSQKVFDEDMEFDEYDFEAEDVLYREDYRKAKKKKKKAKFGLYVLAIVEIAAIGAIIWWWASWVL